MEVRPIDANALKWTIQQINLLQLSETLKFDDIQKNIDNTPTLDYEPVVHCKDCKYFTNNIADKNLRKNFCNRIEADCFHSVAKNDFCSYGAKMDEREK